MSACHCRVLQPNDLKLIEETCKRTPKPNLCLQLLKGDPRAPSADIAGLALILVDVIKAKANEAEKTIKQLLKQGGNKKALSECAVDYKGILILDIPQATRAVRGDPKFADDAVSDCAVEADICENRFNGKSPLTHVNNGMRDVANFQKISLSNSQLSPHANDTLLQETLFELAEHQSGAGIGGHVELHMQRRMALPNTRMPVVFYSMVLLMINNCIEAVSDSGQLKILVLMREIIHSYE
ncbi:hypothetical protein JHK87_055159 [Glycine soja]|nr:hypothetical protein JHK87_055159 [Glycine soja]